MINSEHDLWRLFGGDGPDVPGKIELQFRDLHAKITLLDVGTSKRNKIFRPRFKATNPGRYYRLHCPDIEAVVSQARLYATAMKMGHPSPVITYLGIDPTKT